MGRFEPLPTDPYLRPPGQPRHYGAICAACRSDTKLGTRFCTSCNALRDDVERGHSPRFAALVEGATVMLREGATTSEGAAPAVDVAPALLRKRWRRYRRLAEQLDADASGDAYHDTRIRAKRIRYAAEFTAGLYGDATADFAAALKRAQNELGRYQDAAVAVDLLERTAAVQPLPRHTVFAMGRLAERQREMVRSVAQQFPRTHQRLRLEWRRLRAVLEAGERAG